MQHQIAVLYCRQLLVIVIRQMAARNVHAMNAKVHNYAAVYCVVNNNNNKFSMQSVR